MTFQNNPPTVSNIAQSLVIACMGIGIIFAILVGLTMYNRVMVGCKDFIDAGYSLLMGIFKGIVYYIIVKDFYEPDDTTPEDHWLERALKKFIPRSDADDFV